MEGLVEQVALVAAVHEDRVECPVEVVARADTDRLGRLDRPDDLAGADRQAGGAQHAGEVHDIFRQATAAGVAAAAGPFRVGRGVERHGGVRSGLAALGSAHPVEGGLGANLVEDAHGFAAADAFDIVLVLEQRAESGVERIRLHGDDVELGQSLGPVDGFGDAGQLEQVDVAQLLDEGDDVAA